MKQSSIIILLSLLMSMVCTKASAHDIAVENADGVTIYYNWIKDKTELSVTQGYEYDDDEYDLTRALPDGPYRVYYSGNVVIPESVNYNGISYPVTEIGESAFYRCLNLTSVTIPNGVTTIGKQAFAYCSGEYYGVYMGARAVTNSDATIKDYTIANTREILRGDPSLTSITIPNSVITIGNSAFYGCSDLTSVTIGNHVTTIGEKAFYDCSELTSVTIPNSVTSIGDYAFYKCEGLTSLTISNDITSVSNYAFAYCKSLPSVTIPNGVTSISSYAFYECGILSSVTIPNSVTSIGENAFTGTPWYDNRGNGLIYMGGIAYEYRGTMPDNETIEIKEGTAKINAGLFSGCSGLASVTIPSSVTSIGSNAFDGCTGLTSITIPGGVSSIESYTFYDCFALETVIIQEGVTSIGSHAFDNCNSLSSLTIPSTVTSIGEKAFFYEIDASTVEWGGQKSRHLQVNISDLAAWCNIDFGNSVFNEVDYYYDKNEQWAMKALAALQRYSLCLNGQNMGELEIPKSVTEIKKNAFAYCRTTIKLHDGITSIGDNAFRFGYVSPSSGFNGVKRIGDYAFEYSSLSSIEFGEGLTSIGKYALSNTKIQSIVLPSTIESLGNLVFGECKSLSNVVLPNSLKSLPNGAFCNCTSLKMMRLPSSLTTLGNGVFSGCSNMEYLIFTSENLPSFTYLSDHTLLVIMPQAAYEKGIPNTISSFVTYNSEPMFVELKSKGATSAVLDVYPINDDGRLDDKNMATVTTVGQTPGLYLNWKLDKDNYGIISEKANETLTLTVQEPKALSTKKARLLATVEEEADDMVHYGFEWRRYDAPDGVPSNKVSSPLYNGQIVGTLNNLNSEAYYKYRPFYKSDSGELFYGEWMGLFTGDADVFFEPEVYTKDAEDITKVSALLAGIWLEGTDDIEEKGFEYWTVSGSKTRAVGSDVKKVAVSGSGNAMTTTLEGLKSGATYGFRSYVKTTNGSMTYGEEKTFKTILLGDVDGDGVLTNADADAIAKHIIGQTPSSFNKKMADINEDGHINIVDIVWLTNMIE